MSTAPAVTLIGTGVMGSAIARTLIAAGHPLTVWNRTAAKAEPLRGAGAMVADTLVEALGRSDVILMCVSDQAAVSELLDAPGVAEALRGRTLVQFTTGNAADGRRGKAHAQERGIGFVVGAIIAYPRAVGTPAAVILCGGDRADFDVCEPVLNAVGSPRYVGDPAQPGIIDGALCCVLYATSVGFVQGAVLAQKEGVQLDHYLELALPFFRVNMVESIDDLSQRILSSNYADTQASMDTHLSGIDKMVIALSEEAGVDHEVMKAIKGVFVRAVTEGRGHEDIASLMEVLAEN